MADYGRGEGGGGGDRSYLDGSSEREQQQGRYIHQQHHSFVGNTQPQHLQQSLQFLPHDSAISTSAGVVHGVGGETSSLAAGSHLNSTRGAPPIHHSSEDHLPSLGGTVAGQSDSTPPPNVSSADTTPSSDTNSPGIGGSSSEGGNVSPPSLPSSRQSVGTIGSSRDRGQPRSPLSGFPTVPEESPHPEAEARVQQPPLEGVTTTTATTSMQPNTLAIKLLVSNNMAGSIIGRMGQTISDLQSRSSSRIKLSQSGDYYPGTNDRVCLVQGQVESVRVAMKLILHQLYELHRQQQQQQSLQPSTEASAGVSLPGGEGIDAASSAGADGVGGRSTTPSSAPTSSPFIVRILVPTNCCGMLIGKGGSNIKSIAELSGVSTIRLSAKENEGGYAGPAVGMGPSFPSSTGERILTIIGHALQCCVACSSSVLDCMALHPEISRYTNMTTSYAGRPAAQQLVVAAIGRPGVAGGSMVSRLGSVHGQDPHRLSWHFPTHTSSDESSQHQDQLLLVPQHGSTGSGGLHQASTEALGTTHRLVQQQAPRPDGEAASDEATAPQVPGHGFPSTAQHESQQFYVLATQGSQPVLYAPTGISSDRRSDYGPSFAVGNRSSEVGPAVTEQFSAVNLGASATDSSTAAPSTQDQPDEQLQHSQPLAEGGHQVFGHHPSHPYRQQQQHLQRKRGHGGANVQISVPDALVGAILGRGGQTLSELEASSKTRIKISQRGVFEPGTTNRIVTITGKDAASVESAQYFISQRLAQSVVRPLGLAASATVTDYRPSQGQPMAASHPQEAQQHLTSQQLRVQHQMQMHQQPHAHGQHPQLHAPHQYRAPAFHQQQQHHQQPLESLRGKPSAASRQRDQDVQGVSSPLRYLRQSSSQERLQHSQPQQQSDQPSVMQFSHMSSSSSPFMPSSQGGQLPRSSSHEHLRQQQQQQQPAARGGGGTASGADPNQTRHHTEYNSATPRGGQ